MKEKLNSGCFYAAIDLARKFPHLATKFLELAFKIVGRIPPKK